METFYLGAQPHWLGPDSPLPGKIPVCVPRGRLTGRATLPRATRRWLLDSRGFTVLSRKQDDGHYARWDITPQQYVRGRPRLRRPDRPHGSRSSMDWICEGPVRANTGFEILEHLRRTVISYLELRWLDPTLPIFPVIQGDASLTVDHHLHCVDMYEQAGIDLTALPLVGVGSVCKLQATARIVDLFAALHHRLGGRTRLHAFGVKAQGLAAIAPAVYSADSQAWSKQGRATVKRCPHPDSGVRWEANCPIAAQQWFGTVLTAAARTIPAVWGRQVHTYRRRGNAGLLFEDLEPATAPPTTGERIASAVRVLLPEDTESELAAMLDDFSRVHSDQARAPWPTTASRAA
ncbi:DUF7221 family queuine tRNA-ribosyltransferase-like protein [Spirillospora sp. CA-128828]|uniref:deazapurine DNA modification protein DpdA family protein n=1 Tax=Spirillospora sp. CA-128828 TaxID=3240033 RepID=UPI003D90828B